MWGGRDVVRPGGEWKGREDVYTDNRLLYNDHETPTHLATITNYHGLPVSTACTFSSPQEVCHQYWPDGSTNGIQKYGEYTVSVLQTTKQDGFIQRTISITNPKVMG